ncbi:MAG TPA: hypothetical protein VFU15_06165, partial [Bacteroidia bacterium]|nr:hypothetical protein [Bacteroidia bacterium]
KLLKRVFLHAIEGESILFTDDGNIFATGFVTRYRPENYRGDLTQGVCAFLLDTALNVTWRETYPCFYNSVPHAAIQLRDHSFLVIASTLVYKDTVNWGADDRDDNRMLIIGPGGKSVRDTILLSVKRDRYEQEYYDMYPHAKPEMPFCYLYNVVETDSGFIFSGTFLASLSDWSVILIRTDKNFGLKKIRKISYKLSKYRKIPLWSQSMTCDTAGIVVTARGEYSEDNNFIFRYSYDFDSLWMRQTPGKSLDPPVVSCTSAGHYLMCQSSGNRAYITFFDPSGNQETLPPGTKDIMEIDGICPDGNYAYIISSTKETPRQTYVMKIKLN